ncbi:MAG: hypothetical protein M1819_001282 [Sarea resinae]|nr:MAG: hypothetical protein M1819_001282 [Sarea resinae]
MAQSMGLQFDQTPDPESLAQSSTLGAIPSLNETAFSDVGSKYDEMIPGKTFVEQEVRRRTFWSCFMMDRFLSGGVCRPAILNVKDFKIQLPGSERAFLFGESVRTGYLGDDGEDQLGATEAQNQRGGSLFCTDRSRGPATPDTTYGRSGSGREDTSIEKEESGRWEIGADEGVLSRVVRIMEIWGRVAKWSCYGGRSTESHPPWQRETTIHHLRSLLADFQAALPRHLTFTPANLSAHITSRTSTPYTLMHTIYFLCVIILHREYLPFVPLGCTKAQGPLDSPRYPVEEYDVPPSWWESSANECFKAARDIMDLVRVCKDWGVLVETPIVGFAIYTVAVLGEFCMNFPHMDPEGYMSSCSASSIEASPSANATMSARNYGGAQETRRAVEMIGRMRSRLKMADGWFRTIKRLHCHFARVRKEYEQRSEVLSHPSEPETDSSGRQPQQATPSSTEYKLLEMTLREFGTLDDEDPDVMDVDDREGGKDGSDADQGSGSDAASTAVKSEIIEGARENSIDSAAARRDRWIAINSVASAAAAGQHPDSMLLSNGHNVYQPSEGYSVPGPSSSYRPQDRYPIETNTTSYARPAPPPVTAPTTANSSPTATTAAGTQTFMSPNSNSAHSTSTTSLSVATTTHSPYNQHPSITTISSSSRPLTLPMPPTSAAMQTLPPLKQQQLTPLAATEGTEQHVWGYPEKAAAVAMSREEWLQGLETRFSGDDVLAFVSGSGWEEWGSGGGGKGAGMNHSGVEMGMGMGMGSTVGAGWLRMIWTS